MCTNRIINSLRIEVKWSKVKIIRIDTKHYHVYIINRKYHTYFSATQYYVYYLFKKEAILDIDNLNILKNYRKQETIDKTGKKRSYVHNFRRRKESRDNRPSVICKPPSPSHTQSSRDLCSEEKARPFKRFWRES